MHQHPAEVRGVERGRVPQGEERDPECAQVRWTIEEFHRRAFLGGRLLRLDGRIGRELVRTYIRNQEDEDERHDQMKLEMG